MFWFAHLPSFVLFVHRRAYLEVEISTAVHDGVTFGCFEVVGREEPWTRTGVYRKGGRTNAGINIHREYAVLPTAFTTSGSWSCAAAATFAANLPRGAARARICFPVHEAQTFLSVACVRGILGECDVGQ